MSRCTLLNVSCLRIFFFLQLVWDLLLVFFFAALHVSLGEHSFSLFLVYSVLLFISSFGFLMADLRFLWLRLAYDDEKMERCWARIEGRFHGNTQTRYMAAFLLECVEPAQGQWQLCADFRCVRFC